ncbi:hypothetical protein BRC63_08795 [Halobacteriales archaeon QH_10_70_21]|nr:MAG: hypothetical protein BRC63_08795 [Halobacteriales archaeon QH_10_70_21]
MRNEIICHKPNGMPTASDDRFVNRHEYIFCFTPETDTTSTSSGLKQFITTLLTYGRYLTIGMKHILHHFRRN